MGAGNRGARRCAAKDVCVSIPLTATGDRRSSRAALLAGASLIALAALGTPEAANATCSGADQTISGLTLGPVFSTGGAITVLGGGTVAGRPTGVSAASCFLTALTNSGTISGGTGGASAVGGAAVANAQTIQTLTNKGTIGGGVGGGPVGFGSHAGAGGAGVSNSGNLGLTNSGMITGGAGGAGGLFASGGGGGAEACGAGALQPASAKQASRNGAKNGLIVRVPRTDSDLALSARQNTRRVK
jgi:hypothetical protein